MKIITLLIPITAALALASCFTTQESDTNELLLNCWTHSHEEDAQDSNQLFRPCDFKTFGPSHFRRRLILKDNHQAEYLELSPVDAHTMKSGKWDYDDGSNTLRIQDAGGNTVLTFNVVTLEANKLLLKPV